MNLLCTLDQNLFPIKNILIQTWPQTIATEQVADSEHAERPGTRVLQPGPVAAQPDPGDFAADVHGVADASQFAADCAADNQEQGHPAVTRSPRWIFV